MAGSDRHGTTEALHRAYAARDAKETASVYDDWAGEYERHMREAGYTHPAVVAGMLGRHVPAGQGPVLDAGCGTGVMSEILAGLGYENIVGLDASEGMLELAREKGRYRELHHMFLGDALGLPDNHFAAVVAAGVFTQNHAPLDGFDELIRVTQPGGRLVFSVARTYLEGLYQERSRRLAEAGLWREVAASERYNSATLTDTLISQVFVCEAI